MPKEGGDPQAALRWTLAALPRAASVGAWTQTVFTSPGGSPWRTKGAGWHENWIFHNGKHEAQTGEGTCQRPLTRSDPALFLQDDSGCSHGWSAPYVPGLC